MPYTRDESAYRALHREIMVPVFECEQCEYNKECKNVKKEKRIEINWDPIRGDRPPQEFLEINEGVYGE